MPRVPDDEPEDDTLRAGAYRAKVEGCTERWSKKDGHLMFELRFSASSFSGRHLCYDYIMFEGGGRFYGRKKLEAFGYQKGDEVEAHALVGQEVWVHTVEDEYQGKRQLKVAVDRGTHAGYSVTKPDAGVVEPEVPRNMGDDPFVSSEDGDDALDLRTPF
jgi:hypothetical protein